MISELTIDLDLDTLYDLGGACCFTFFHGGGGGVGGKIEVDKGSLLS